MADQINWGPDHVSRHTGVFISFLLPFKDTIVLSLFLNC